jgi:ferredoxin
MSKYVLKKDKVEGALNALANANVVYIPVKNKRGLVEYKELGKDASATDMKLDCRPDVPPKAILFPQTQVLFTFKKVDGKITITPTEPDPRDKIIFGVRPCDTVAISVMDKVFLEGKFIDPYYKARRRRVAIFTVACDGPADPNCFCPSTGGSPAGTEGSDVMLYDVGDSYLVEDITEKGAKLLEALRGDLEKPSTGQEKRKDEIIRKAESAEGFTRKIAVESIGKLDSSFDSKYWDDVAKRCLSCGACTYYCPTCHCFDINDEPGSKRVRTWDSCQFSNFTMHTSSHNPRTAKAQRLRNRYYHKFKYSKDSTGRYLCVGCGRCIALCPAGLDITKVISEVK